MLKLALKAENDWYASFKSQHLKSFETFIIKQYKPLFRILNVGVDKKTVHFWMYVFHGNLEAIETTSFCDLYFLSEPLHLEEINECWQKHLSCRLEELML